MSDNLDKLQQLSQVLSQGGKPMEYVQEQVSNQSDASSLSEDELRAFADDYDTKLSQELGCPVYTIVKYDLPSNLYSVTFKEAYFKDRRSATRQYPTSKVGYSLEELLLANMILSINFERIDENADNIRNPINKLAIFPSSDTSYILSTFLSISTLSAEMSGLIKSNTEKVLQSPSFNGIHTISQDELPTGSFSITFTEPTSNDRWNAEKTYPGSEDRQCGYSLEELIFAKQIVALNGEPVSKQSKETINLLNDWSHIDVQYAVASFTNLFNLSEEKSNASKTLGKSFLEKRKNRIVKSH
jgi:hypothetical protein